MIMNQSIRTLKIALRSALADEANSAQMIYDAFVDVVRAEKVAAESVATKTRDTLALLESTKVPDYLASPPAYFSSNLPGGLGDDTISIT